MNVPAGGLGAAIPRPPAGYQTCNVHDGQQTLLAHGARRQINHLVRIPTHGPTVCGLTRFATLPAVPDLPGWSMGGGVTGPGIEQAPCPTCWQGVSHTPRQRWGTCCPHDPECDHSFLSDDALARWMDTPITDEEAAELEEP